MDMPKVRDGDPFFLTQSFVNDTIDLHERFERGVLEPGRDPLPLALPYVPARIKNTSGSDVDRFRLLGISDSVWAPSDRLKSFQNQMMFEGVTPTNSYYGKWGVTLGPIKSGKWGWVAVAGLVVIEVSVPGTIHPWRYVDITPSSTVGKEAWAGAAEIRAVGTDSGKRWALCQLGLWQAPVYKGLTDGAITAGSSGSVEIYINGIAKETVTAYDAWMDGGQDMADNTPCVLYFDRDYATPRWDIINAECAAA